MSEPQADYISNADHGDETDVRREPGAEAPRLPGTWVGRFDAAYWQAQAETAIRALEQAQAGLAAALAQLDALKRQLAESEGRGRRRLTHDATQGMRGRRRA